MTPQDDAALWAWGQQEADRQMLETLLTLDPVEQEYFDTLAHCYAQDGIPLVDFVQDWREFHQ